MVTTTGIDPVAVYTLKEAATLCGKPYNRLYYYYRKGHLHCIKERYTNSLNVRGAELIRFIEQLYEEVA